MIVDVDTLQPLIAEWLPNQRWFAGKGRPIDAASARCSRARITSTDFSVGSISNDSRTAPESQRRETL